MRIPGLTYALAFTYAWYIKSRDEFAANKEDGIKRETNTVGDPVGYKMEDGIILTNKAVEDAIFSVRRTDSYVVTYFSKKAHHDSSSSTTICAPGMAEAKSVTGLTDATAWSDVRSGVTLISWKGWYQSSWNSKKPLVTINTEELTEE